MSYTSAGYTAPAGIDSREKVKEYQRALGVKADGIWGPATQAAYERSRAAASDPWRESYPTGNGSPSANNGDIWSQSYPTGGNSSPSGNQADPWSTNLSQFKDYYDTILGSINVPHVSVNVPSREELASTYSASLRPSAERAIASRREMGDTNKAEYDADAAARGMGASTFVSSMKEREDDDIARDVMNIETQYTATLAEQIASAMMEYSRLQASADQANAAMLFNAQNTALGMAGQWYSNYMNAIAEQASAVKKTVSSYSAPSYGSSKKAAASAKASPAKGTKTSPRLTELDYIDYVERLSEANREGLFFADSDYWRARRNELIAALGRNTYEQLRRKYATGAPMGAGVATSASWLNRTR